MQVSEVVHTSGTIDGATLLLAGGNRQYSWEGGTIGNTVEIPVNGIMGINGDNVKKLDGGLISNFGSITWTQSGNIELENDALILGQTSSTFTGLGNNAEITFAGFLGNNRLHLESGASFEA